jgi:uncharacterized membrane protein
MKWLLLLTGLLHVAFMCCEVFPLSKPPWLLRLIGDKWPASRTFTLDQQVLVSIIVRNAGVYNGILAGGLLWTACGIFGVCAAVSLDVARVMLIGAVVAGAFGGITLKSGVCWAQSALGAITLFLLRG